MLNILQLVLLQKRLFLDILKFSIKDEIAVSIILIPEVIAAKNKSTKNITPNNSGNGSFIKICGREIKTKVAPAVGSTPKENTTGKITIPAVTAIKVSKNIKVYADLKIFVFSFEILPFRYIFKTKVI